MSIIILSWEVGNQENKSIRPEKFVPALVPGAVQLDIAHAEKHPPCFYADQYKRYDGLENKYWMYRTRFSRPELRAEQRLFYVAKGIDYEFEILLNNKKLLYQEGMFTPVYLDITDYLLDNNELQIIIYPAPKKPGAQPGPDQASQSCKPAVSYGWDWHPRLIPLGIWDDTYLEVRHKSHLRHIMYTYVLSNDLCSAAMHLAAKGKNLTGCTCCWTVRDAENRIVLEEKRQIKTDDFASDSVINNVQLWWPHDQGKPYLYTSCLELFSQDGILLETSSKKIGFRRVELVMNQGAWDEPRLFPKTRSIPPMQLCINGRNIFCKGSNWVNPDIFWGRITRSTYSALLDKAFDANFNLLRVWGGAIINKESFYELCDAMGIMVWQEFPLACNNYIATEKYLKILEQESESIINKVKQHPCLAMWSGGNELFNSWSGMTDQSLALRLLNAQCYRLDPHTPFIYTSPIMGVGHGHYVFRDENNGGEVFQWMQNAHCSAYTEFGIPGLATLEVLKTIIPEEELFPPKPGTAWESHHAFNAWRSDTWLSPQILEYYFGIPENLQELIANSQLLQSEGYKFIYEEARRQKPYCAMALNWCFNEAWPAAVNNSLISWPCLPKPAFFAVSQACRITLASLRPLKFTWAAGEIFNGELFMLSDSPEIIDGGIITVSVHCGLSEQMLYEWTFPEIPANKNITGPKIKFQVPRRDKDRFEIRVSVKDRPELSSTYTFLFGR